MRQAIISRTFTEMSPGLPLTQRLTDMLYKMRLTQSIEGQHLDNTQPEKWMERCTSAPGGRG